MAFRFPVLTASDADRQPLALTDRFRHSTLRNVITATAIGCFSLLQGGDSPKKKIAAPADAIEALLQESVDLDTIPHGESLLNKLLHVTVETRNGEQRIPFRVIRDGNELILCMEKGVFRNGNAIMGIGRVSEQITDVTTQKDSIRLHSTDYGYADVRRSDVRDIVQSLATAPQSQETLSILASAHYVPAEGSGIQMAHTLFHSVSDMFSANQASVESDQSTHTVTFRRERPVQIARINR